MTFNIFGIDFYWNDRLFGFWIGTFDSEEKQR
ncbi:hypothetical protein LCGC14_2074460, partial [marine sediment metagenome]